MSYHVSPSGKGWRLRRSGGVRALRRYESESEAWAEARKRALFDGCDAYLHDEGGRISVRFDGGNRTVGMEKGQDYVLGYMCGTDWELELGMASGGNVVFATPEDAVKNSRCTEECGLVEVKVSFSRWVKEPVDE